MTSFRLLAVGLALLGIAIMTPSHAQTKIQDQGDFLVSYERSTSQIHEEFRRIFQEDRYLEDIAADINASLALPYDVGMSFAPCGTANAFYDPEQYTIIMCYELVEYFAGLFAEEYDNDEDLGLAILGATTFTLFHELGHALIHVLELPATGREEDAVDQLAATILLAEDEDGYSDADSVLDAATWFLRGFEAQEDNNTRFDQLAFHGEHSLDAQRFYNLMCWAYGSNQQEFSDLVSDEDGLPENRAARCPTEYERMSNAWTRLLEPYWK